jgi:hypothetical protein
MNNMLIPVPIMKLNINGIRSYPKTHRDKTETDGKMSPSVLCLCHS